MALSASRWSEMARAGDDAVESPTAGRALLPVEKDGNEVDPIGERGGGAG